MDNPQTLTWSLLVLLEPRLGQLHLDCRFADHRDPNGFDKEQAWNGTPDTPGLKYRLEHMVGRSAVGQDSRILSSEAYDFAYQECYRALPPNRPGNGLAGVLENQTFHPRTGA